MSWTTRKTKHGYHHWLVWTIAILAIAGCLSWPKVIGRYRLWNARHQVEQGWGSLAHGDYRHAMLYARNALEVMPMDAGATEIMARVCEGTGLSAVAAQWRSRLDTIMPGNLENILAWASDSLKAGDVSAAERIISMLKPEPRDNAGYHATAAELAMAKRDTATAERHWAEASRLDPKEDRFRLHLAEIRLGSKDPALRESALSALTEISRKPPKSIEALRILLADALRLRDYQRAAELSDALVMDPGAIFEDKLKRLGALRTMRLFESTGYLIELRDAALSNPADLYLLFMWMNQNDLAFMVSEWTRDLTSDLIGAPPVCVAVADAYVRSSEWQRLQEYLDERSWGELDYLRRIFLARAFEKLDEAEQAAREWKDGASAARSGSDSRDRLERVVRLAIGWGWEQRAQEVMWTMVNAPNCPRWMLDALWLIAIENSDTAQLQKLAAAFVQSDSKSVTFRNNYAFFTLLIHSEQGNPHREAEKLFSEHPGDSAIAVTRALSLYQQGKTAEALAITSGLPAAELAKPNVAFYHSIFLIAAGEAAEAEAFLPRGQSRKMFHEEKALFARARDAAAKAADEQDIAISAKAVRAQRAVRELEAEQAVAAARAAKAAQEAGDVK